ncbi:uncharacterized protein (DUF58 family) [Tamilnaduibacter salinus]|uniref:Uncharacterized protein (DUF58 family) n=1 Tax=Tamilnaduibacter salinus TaxID=1484056 RepID=A0A2U1CZN8_9GAMM|nr:uncharacterized protein (DUF58 family) [Tamilnaduibacter salinus]
MKNPLRHRWRRWVNRRIPRSDHQVLGQRNVFILPTGAGVVFGLLLVIMLITGINYQNSLIYLLVFMLGALFVAAMHQTHRNLAGTEITLVEAGEGFPGQELGFVFHLGRAGGDAIQLMLMTEDGTERSVSVTHEEVISVRLPIRGTRRGPVRVSRIRIETRFPFGLLRAWSWIRPASEGLCYPAPLRPAPESGADHLGDSGDQRRKDAMDHVDIRPWRQGDLSQRVQWKRYARTGELVIADWEGDASDPVWLDFEAWPGADRELRLSYLAWLLEDRERAGQPWGLRFPGFERGPDNGAEHRREGLRALGRFGLEAQSASTKNASHRTSREAA